MSTEQKKSVTFKRVQGNFSHINKISHGNFEDPNLTVSCPILTIHGNHDDPTGPNAQSVCKKLATCGLLNYFGAYESLSNRIVVEPIILDKRGIKIAIYGMGFMPDFRLRKAFENNEVEFVKPPQDTFNILVVHQNRVPLSKTKYIPDDFYPDFIHLLIRGHEHSAQSPEPLLNSKVAGLVFQPGSTVATSISTMEAGPKQVALFSVTLEDSSATPKDMFKLEYKLISLKSSRPMLMKDISQKEITKHIKKSGKKRISAIEYQKLSQEFVRECIQIALADYYSKLKKNFGTSGDVQNQFSTPELPLLRVRLEYISRNERFDELEISSEFYPSKVANKDIILFRKQKLTTSSDGEIENATFIDEESQDVIDDFECIDLGEERRDTIDVMIENYFKDKPKDQWLKVLSLEEYTNAVRGSSEDGNVISKVLAKKKQSILLDYQLAVANEAIAEKQFHDEEKVEKWFLAQMNKQLI